MNNIERKIFINNDFDIVLARMQAREIAKEMGFGAADQARISLAASELARVLIWNINILSEILLTDIMNNGNRGVRVTCMISLDHVDLPAENGTHWSQVSSPVSRSLAGACHLLDESTVEEQGENSARVTLTKWLR